MVEERTDRDLESREATQRPTDAWKPTSQLPVPNPVEGWAFRYIRTSSLGSSDNTNVSARFREGWVPVRAQDHPELKIMSDIDSRYKEGVEVGGLLLCKIATETVEQRNTYYNSLAKQQVESVDHGFLNDQDPRMPKYNDSTSRTQFRKG